MNVLKKPLSYIEQIEKLKEHNMLVPDKDFALKVLSEKNYYRFTGYALQFRIEKNKSDYIDGTSFNDVYRIYCFDEALRNLLRQYIEIIEVHFRAQISYNFSIAKCTKAPYDQHYNRDNYYKKKEFDAVMSSFSHDEKYYHDSLIMQHHKKNYQGKLPLWAMTEMLSFSNLSKLYSCMYRTEQNAIALSVGSGPITLANNLHCLSVLRNKCAHAARLYNTTFNPPASFTSSFLRNHPEVKNTTLFAYILIVLKRLPNDEIRKRFNCELQNVIDEYKYNIDFKLIGFPSNYLDILSNTMEQRPCNKKLKNCL